MRKTLPASLVAVAGIVVACSSFDTNVWRSEQTAVDLGAGAHNVWTNYYINATNSATITPEQRQKLDDEQRAVKAARIKLAASIATVDALRASYKTNSELKGPVLGALATAMSNSSNLVYLANFLKNQ